MVKPPNFWDYLHEWAAHLPFAWRRGAIVMTVVISVALFGLLWLGWGLDAYPTSVFLIGTGTVAAVDVLVLWPYQLWRTNKIEIADLREHLRPKIKIVSIREETKAYLLHGIEREFVLEILNDSAIELSNCLIKI